MWTSGNGRQRDCSSQHPGLTVKVQHTTKIRSARPLLAFVKHSCVTQQTVRSHSGRHTMINLLKHAGLPDTVAKFYARIKDQKTFESYGMCTETQATKTLQTSKAVQRLFADAYSKAPRMCVTKKSKATKTKVQQTTANKSIKGKRLLADPKHGSKK